MKIKVPGSKSYTQRALILSALASGKSVLKNALASDDTEHMINALKSLGIQITRGGGASLEVNGGTFASPAEKLFCGNSGTTMRFLTALTSCLGIECTLFGNERMHKRPIQNLVNALNDLGGKVSDTKGYPPVYVKNKVPGGKCIMKGDVSSQFISAILMCAPYCEKDVLLEVRGRLVSRPYVYMTISIMHNFGINIISTFEPDFTIFDIKARRHYKPCEYEIEGDASSATYFWALGKLLEKEITVENVPSDSLQGDRGFKNLIENFKPGEFDMNSLPDSVPTLAVFAAFQKGKTVIHGAANLRVKECDRLHALATELEKIGCRCEELPDGLAIYGDPSNLHGAQIETYSDHRMAMSFALAKAKIPSIIIANPDCVSKTYPDFWKDFKKAI